MPTREAAAAWAEAYRQAWVDRDAAAAGALFTEGSAYRSYIFDEPHQGRSGVESYWSGVAANQTEVEVVMGAPFVDGDRVAVEFWTNMKVDGEPVTLPGCLLLRFDESGLCADLREYWHYLPETHDPPEGWGS